jgi:glycosyltransferase involved in cell wall biosynthesis
MLAAGRSPAKGAPRLSQVDSARTIADDRPKFTCPPCGSGRDRRHMHRRTSLIVTTCDRPDALALLLASVARQTEAPLEVVVCDDGSGPATREVVDHWRDRLLCDLRQVWQPRDGRGPARIRNLGIATAAGEYVVTLDGDVVLDPNFVADHATAARLGQWVQGVHARLSATASAALLASRRSAALGWRQGASGGWHAIRSPWLARVIGQREPQASQLATCNQAYWRADLVRANGFDERFGPGDTEAREIAARLGHAGLESVYLRHLAVAWRLASPPRGPARREDDERLLAETLRTRATRAPVGLDVHGIAA